ncbi:MAG TPA: hypothetical protein VGC04_10700 [Cellulomonas sp.]
MTWLAWRQMRAGVWLAAAAVVLVALAVLATWHGLDRAWVGSGSSTCGADCDTAFPDFLGGTKRGLVDVLYQWSVGLRAVPALVGMFWGVLLVAPELEAGTFRVSWTQSVSRARWLAAKVAVGAVATVLVTGLLSWALTVWAHGLDWATGSVASSFAARGVVPVGYALFAFALGVATGLLFRRVVPAMLVTLGGYVAVTYAVERWLRDRLISPVVVDQVLQAHSAHESGNGFGTILMSGATAVAPGGWTLSDQTLAADGQDWARDIPSNCGQGQSQQACDDWLAGLGLHRHLVYHPAAHFWPLQWAETGLLVAAAVVLVGLCFWWVRRRS